ncbi:MAG: hypothetical protein PHQ75_14470, partial [Thermoguttaceae bacterium]|nr:hypothetical protein [Thermoguttaceae bacterium]
MRFAVTRYFVAPLSVLLILVISCLISYHSSEAAETQNRVAPLVNSELEFPGPAPGKAIATLGNGQAILQNNVLSFDCAFDGKMLRPESFTFKSDNKQLNLKGSELFTLRLGKAPLPGSFEVAASQFVLDTKPILTDLKGNLSSVRLEERFDGKEISARFTCPKTGMVVRWKAILRDNLSYVRQEVVLASPETPVELLEVVLLDFNCKTARESAPIAGSPIVSDSMFFALEHPASNNTVVQGRVRCSYPCGMALRDPATAAYSTVLGVWPEGQLRRSFLYYLECRRACPYHSFLQQNNGSQIGRIYYFHTDPKDQPAFRINQAKLWSSIMEQFCVELVEKRGVVFDSFVHDYGWDDEKLVWRFHEGYPNGFQPFFDLIDRHHSHFGIWFSPWGGYPGKKVRAPEGSRQGLELYMCTEKKPRFYLTLAGPRYYDHVLSACLGMLRHQKVNYFKFDGFGFGISKTGEPQDVNVCRSDIEGVWRLMNDIRKADPSVFINPSTGTWPSPFWLVEADSIWRGAFDTGYTGEKGSKRQQWITYRDAAVYDLVHNRGPLYPISSLMIHGVEINKGGRIVTFDEQDMDDEIRAFFATGVNLQELYISPELLAKRHWDTLAECAKWSRANAQTLADIHWIGGDPAKLEVYGRAAWTSKNAIITLRNLSDEEASIELDAAKIFELPLGAPAIYTMKSS